MAGRNAPEQPSEAEAIRELFAFAARRPIWVETAEGFLEVQNNLARILEPAILGILEQRPSSIKEFHFSDEGRIRASVSSPGTLQAWRAYSKNPERLAREGQGPSVGFSAHLAGEGGRRLSLGFYNGDIAGSAARLSIQSVPHESSRVHYELAMPIEPCDELSFQGTVPLEGRSILLWLCGGNESVTSLPFGSVPIAGMTETYEQHGRYGLGHHLLWHAARDIHAHAELG